ncbi:MAG: electron transfer flavoprotein subunit beta/FixA family protein [Clostridia bacterium]|nr:electron transfer flavoprotein subunit beta/FixA family protein [Clostridia bacterium]MBQ4249838.1 electron transfer flavoprotein subunit beta/FixA family protein [Clostridia bacterium]
MEIVVCIKQVPDTTEITIDPVTNTLNRAGVPAIVNPFDAYALELAVQYKEKYANDAHITVVSMGPPQAKAALKECLSVGAEEAYLVTDRAFGGSDTLATGYIISTTLKKICQLKGIDKFDIIFCGKQAIDGDTAQVGPQTAEYMDLPQVTYAVDMEECPTPGAVRVKKECEDGFRVIELPTPCIITVTKPKWEPRLATIKSKMAANKKVIAEITAADMEGLIDTARCGLKGSPTKVRKTFVPQKKQGGLKIEGETAGDAAKKLVGLLADAKII